MLLFGKNDTQRLFGVVALLANDDLDGCAVEAKGLAQAVFDEAAVGEVEELHAVAEDDEGGRSHRDLRHVVDLEAASLVGRGLNADHGLAKHVVEHARGDAQKRLVMHELDALKEVAHALSRLGGDVNDGGVGHIGKCGADLGVELVDGGVVLLDQIPLVDHDDHGLARLVRDARDLLVLLGDAGLGVDQEQADLGPLHRHMGAENAEMLDAVIDLGLAANACRVDEGKGADLVLQSRVHSVARGACDVGDDQAVLADELVDDGGFARVGLADDGYVNAVVLGLLRLPLTKGVDAGVEQISRAAAVNGGYADGLLVKAKLVELIELHGRPSYAVTLVDAGHDGLAALLEHDGDVAVAGGESRADVAHSWRTMGLAYC